MMMNLNYNYEFEIEIEFDVDDDIIVVAPVQHDQMIHQHSLINVLSTYISSSSYIYIYY